MNTKIKTNQAKGISVLIIVVLAFALPMKKANAQISQFANGVYYTNGTANGQLRTVNNGGYPIQNDPNYLIQSGRQLVNWAAPYVQAGQQAYNAYNGYYSRNANWGMGYLPKQYFVNNGYQTYPKPPYVPGVIWYTATSARPAR
jgi:hypothetical protein